MLFRSVKVEALVRLDSYKIINDVIDGAIRYGYKRAHKHIEFPSEEFIIEEIHRSVMNDLCDILKFEE